MEHQIEEMSDIKLRMCILDYFRHKNKSTSERSETCQPPLDNFVRNSFDKLHTTIGEDFDTPTITDAQKLCLENGLRRLNFIDFLYAHELYNKSDWQEDTKVSRLEKVETQLKLTLVEVGCECLSDQIIETYFDRIFTQSLFTSSSGIQIYDNGYNWKAEKYCAQKFLIDNYLAGDFENKIILNPTDFDPTEMKFFCPMKINQLRNNVNKRFYASFESTEADCIVRLNRHVKFFEKMLRLQVFNELDSTREEKLHEGRLIVKMLPKVSRNIYECTGKLDVMNKLK